MQLLVTVFFISHSLESISTSKRRHKSLLLFQGYVTSGENPGDLLRRSRIDTSENSSAYRCYSREEITSSELVQAGKEQTSVRLRPVTSHNSKFEIDFEINNSP